MRLPSGEECHNLVVLTRRVTRQEAVMFHCRRRPLFEEGLDTSFKSSFSELLQSGNRLSVRSSTPRDGP
jgi:hypothetical protein